MKTTEIPWILKIKRLSICPQEWAVRFLFLCRRLVFFMSFGPSSFKSSPSSFGWSQWPWCLPELHQGQTLGSVHMPLTHASPCHMPVLPHWGVFLEAKNNSAPDLGDIFPQRKRKQPNPTQGFGQTTVWMKITILYFAKTSLIKNMQIQWFCWVFAECAPAGYSFLHCLQVSSHSA